MCIIKFGFVAVAEQNPFQSFTRLLAPVLEPRLKTVIRAYLVSIIEKGVIPVGSNFKGSRMGIRQSHKVGVG